MGLYMNQRENRSELQQRLDAELREKAKARSLVEDADTTVDGVEDSKYIEDTKQTTGLALVWIGVIVFAIFAFGYFIYSVSAGN
jgi:DNA recombination-dependent growth factor C